MVQILSNVAELGEIGKGSHYQYRGLMAQAAQHGFEFAARLLVAIAPESDRRVANALNQVECLLALLLAQRINEQENEKPNIFFERKISVEKLLGRDDE